MTLSPSAAVADSLQVPSAPSCPKYRSLNSSSSPSPSVWQMYFKLMDQTLVIHVCCINKQMENCSDSHIVHKEAQNWMRIEVRET